MRAWGHPSQLGLGTWSFSGDVWGSQSKSDSLAAVQEAMAHGCELIDTALSYGEGRSERIVGEAVAGHRDSLRLVTKVPPKNDIWGPPDEVPVHDTFPRDWIVASCDNSLRNLRTDYIDVLLLHTWNRTWPADGEWRDSMEELSAQGKIRSYGISVDDCGAADANAVMVKGLSAVELVYNAINQDAAFSSGSNCISVFDDFDRAWPPAGGPPFWQVPARSFQGR